jgi:hypothetical protein
MRFRTLTYLCAVTAVCAFPLSDTFAQRGGRGGGGRGGGGGRNGASFSPSFSNGGHSNDGTHESFYRGSNFDSSNRSDGNREAFSRTFSNNFDRDFARGFRNDNDRFTDRIRNDFGGFDRHDLPYRFGWWDSRGWGNHWYSPWLFSRWRDRPYYWWGWTPAGVLTDWLVFGFDRPYYWNYGPDGNIYYDGDYVYYDGRRTMSADDYYDYVSDLAHDVPDISQADAEKMDWKPLGVFAIRREGESQSTRSIQLAVNKDGVIVGTYFNREKNKAYPVTGTVDKHSERATWSFEDKNNKHIIFETSIYNLTKDSTQVMVHFGPKPDDAEIWQLVRLEQPDESAHSNSQHELP